MWLLSERGQLEERGRGGEGEQRMGELENGSAGEMDEHSPGQVIQCD